VLSSVVLFMGALVIWIMNMILKSQKIHNLFGHI
jgi:hypothetical protein